MQCYKYGVIGASPLGLASAQQFALLGSVALIGPALPLVGNTACFALSLRSQKYLESLGFFLQEGTSVHTLIIGGGYGKGWRITSKKSHSLGYNITQIELLQILKKHLNPEVQVFSSLLQNIIRMPQGYILEIESGQKIYVQKLIAADGMHSTVRSILKPKWDFFKKSSREALTFYKEDCNFDPNTAYQNFHRGKIIARLPLQGNCYYHVITAAKHCLEDLKIPNSKQIALWNYQVSLDDLYSCAYVGWAGQSLDPNSAAGLNHALWEVEQIYEIWKHDAPKGTYSSLTQNIQRKRQQVRELIQSNKSFLSCIDWIPQAVLRRNLEIFTGQELEVTRCVFPSMLL